MTYLKLEQVCNNVFVYPNIQHDFLNMTSTVCKKSFRVVQIYLNYKEIAEDMLNLG